MARKEITGFIRSTFRSVWALELLCLLRRDPRAWTQAEMVAALRGSELIVAQSLAGLAAAGLVTVDDAGGARYAPESEALDALAGEAEEYFATSPDAVRRLIARR